MGSISASSISKSARVTNYHIIRTGPLIVASSTRLMFSPLIPTSCASKCDCPTAYSGGNRAEYFKFGSIRLRASLDINAFEVKAPIFSIFPTKENRYCLSISFISMDSSQNDNLKGGLFESNQMVLSSHFPQVVH